MEIQESAYEWYLKPLVGGRVGVERGSKTCKDKTLGFSLHFTVPIWSQHSSHYWNNHPCDKQQCKQEKQEGYVVSGAFWNVYCQKLYNIFLLSCQYEKNQWFLHWFFFNLLKYSCFTMLCYFLLYSKVNLPDVHIYPLFFGFPSHLGHRRAQNRVPCAIQ